MSIIIGSHVAVSGNDMLLGAIKESIANGANAIMFYTGAPQNNLRKDISLFKKDEALLLMEQFGLNKDNVIIHAPYIINLANSIEANKYQTAVEVLANEIKRVRLLGFNKLVVHPGSHVGEGVEIGINQAIKAINQVLANDSSNVRILIETMAGKGSEIGFTFDQVKAIIQNVNNQDRIGVCLDTCHIHDAGYDIINAYEEVIQEFDRIIGINNLYCIHLNDSKNEQNARKDRHENIGFGKIGFDPLMQFVYDERFKNVPKILETPYIGDNSPYKEEIIMIKSRVFDQKLKDKFMINQ